jgi:hypothetical protein
LDELLEPTPSPSQPVVSSQSPPGFSQLEEDDVSLLTSLNSTVSPDLPPNNLSQLPVYRGKELVTPASDPGTSSSLPPDLNTKVFAWSRGIATDLSPLQTRSSRKKKELLSTQTTTTDLPTQEGKALRAMKALARSK